jgi:hypothetical protein
MKKNVGLGTMGLVLAFVLVFSGCVTGPETLGGSITITGIPAEYNGKTIAGTYRGKNAEGKNWTVTGKDAIDSKVDATIVDGQVAMGAYMKGPIGTTNFTANFLFDIHDLSLSSRYNTTERIYFEGVELQNGSAELNWDSGIKTGIVTITGIPENYNGGQVEGVFGNANIFIGQTLTIGSGGLLGALAGIPTPSGTELTMIGDIVDGKLGIALRSPVVDEEAQKKLISITVGEPSYKPYTETAVKDVVLAITVDTVQTSEYSSKAVSESYIFKSVSFTDGNANISFSDGIKINQE